MLQHHNIYEAIKAAKRRQKGKKTVQNISRQRVQRFIKGQSKATIEELERILAAFDLSIIVVNKAERQQIERILAILAENKGKNAE